MTGFENEPVSRIEWRAASKLKANDYNPNIVFNPELKLLERSIMMTGWVQPILITQDGTIIDGFHRAQLAAHSKFMLDRYAGLCPCVVLDVTRAAAMLLTVRMNRAKGSHVALRMSAMVKELIDVHDVSRDQIATEIGATMDEVNLLYQDGVFKAKNISNYRYSKAWYPVEV